MLNVTRLLCGIPTPGDEVRYGERSRHHLAVRSPGGAHHRPIVVWNVTRRCNLRCIHCYTASTDRAAPGELTTEQARDVVRDLASFGVPAILFSGGEPLVREDVYDLMAYAVSLGANPVLSSNGTMLTDSAVAQLKSAGVTRVGISLDGLEPTNDHFRRVTGAFQQALDGIRRSLNAGFRVSIRFTLTRHNVDELDGLFDLVERERVPRFCIYHLAYAGRGRKLLPIDLDSEQRREVVESIFRHTLAAHKRGQDLEVLTVDNHADAAFLLLWAREHLPERVPEIQDLLARNGGNSTGKGIGCIDERGNVHPDQFWRTQSVGNVKERPFSAIWQDENIPLLSLLRNRHSLLPERCKACRFISLCNGNLRVRAEAATGNPWGDDPGCYLTDEERTGEPSLALA